MIEKIKEIIRNNKDVKISDIFANCDGKRKEVQGTLEELIENGDVIFKEGNYFLPSQLGLYKGIVVSVKKRFGFVACDELEDEILVDAQFLGNALLNDVVYLKNIGGTYYNVEKIIKRSRHEVVGEVCQLKKLTYLLVKGISTEDIIFKFDENEFENEAIVKCEIVSFDNNVIHVKGVKKLGDKNAPGIDITRILVENDCPIEFSDEVYAQVNNLPQEVSEEEIEGRLDLRDELIFTIDGEDARDLDDAVSVAPIEGDFELEFTLLMFHIMLNNIHR